MRQKYVLACTCGGVWVGEHDHITPEMKARLDAQFRDAHNEPGCADCDRATANRNRRNAERRRERQEQAGERSER